MGVRLSSGFVEADSSQHGRKWYGESELQQLWGWDSHQSHRKASEQGPRLGYWPAVMGTTSAEIWFKGAPSATIWAKEFGETPLEPKSSRKEPARGGDVWTCPPPPLLTDSHLAPQEELLWAQLTEGIALQPIHFVCVGVGGASTLLGYQQAWANV